MAKTPRFGRYEILSKLGEGGMGAVYKVFDPELQRIVALKVITIPDKDGSYTRRFRREVTLAARLQHPNVIPIYEYGTLDKKPFFTMSYVEGIDLGDFVDQKGAMEESLALEIMMKMASAVSYAHNNGVLHRDIKPDNIMLDSNFEPYLMDFGLAKELESKHTRLTQTGAIVGTPEYMAPEQAYGKSKSALFPADIYALGGTLYFMLTGRAPFEGEDAMELLLKVVDEDPPKLRKLNPEVSKDVSKIVNKCLEKDPQDRYESARHLFVDLKAAYQGRPLMAHQTSMIRWVKIQWRRNRSTLSPVLMGLMLIIGIAIGINLQSPATPPVQEGENDKVAQKEKKEEPEVDNSEKEKKKEKYTDKSYNYRQAFQRGKKGSSWGSKEEEKEKRESKNPLVSQAGNSPLKVNIKALQKEPLDRVAQELSRLLKGERRPVYQILAQRAPQWMDSEKEREKVVKLLVQGLVEGKGGLPQEIRNKLAQLGEKIYPILEEILFTSPQPEARREGVKVIGKIADPQFIPALAHALLTDKNPDVRRAIAKNLRSMGKYSHAVRSMVKEALGQETDEATKRELKKTLRRGYRPPFDMPARGMKRIISHLNHKFPKVRRAAALVLAHCREKVPGAKEALEKAQKKQWTAQGELALLQAQISQETLPFSRLIDLLEHQQVGLQKRSLRLLAKMEWPSRDLSSREKSKIWSQIRDYLDRSESIETRIQAVEVLGKLAARDKSRVPQLERFLDDDKVELRRAAAKGIGEMGQKGREMGIKLFERGDGKKSLALVILGSLPPSEVRKLSQEDLGKIKKYIQFRMKKREILEPSLELISKVDNRLRLFVPLLLDTLKVVPPPSQKKILAILQSIPAGELKKVTFRVVARGKEELAEKWFFSLARRGEEGIPSLIYFLRRGNYQNNKALHRAILSLGWGRIPTLLKHSQKLNSSQREILYILFSSWKEKGAAELGKVARDKGRGRTFRLYAIQALVYNKSEKAYEILMDLKGKDFEGEIRMKAIQALGQIGDYRAWADLHVMTKTGSSSSLRSMAVEVVKKLEIEVLDRLKKLNKIKEGQIDFLQALAFKGQTKDIRALALRTLAGFGPEAYEALLPFVLSKLLKNDSYEELRWLIQLFGREAHKDLRNIMKSFKKNKKWDRYFLALFHLAQMGNREAVEELEKLFLENLFEVSRADFEKRLKVAPTFLLMGNFDIVKEIVKEVKVEHLRGRKKKRFQKLMAAMKDVYPPLENLINSTYFQKKKFVNNFSRKKRNYLLWVFNNSVRNPKSLWTLRAFLYDLTEKKGVEKFKCLARVNKWKKASWNEKRTFVLRKILSAVKKHIEQRDSKDRIAFEREIYLASLTPYLKELLYSKDQRMVNVARILLKEIGKKFKGARLALEEWRKKRR